MPGLIPTIKGGVLGWSQGKAPEPLLRCMGENQLWSIKDCETGVTGAVGGQMSLEGKVLGQSPLKLLNVVILVEALSPWHPYPTHNLLSVLPLLMDVDSRDTDCQQHLGDQE